MDIFNGIILVLGIVFVIVHLVGLIVAESWRGYLLSVIGLLFSTVGVVLPLAYFGVFK